MIKEIDLKDVSMLQFSLIQRTENQIHGMSRKDDLTEMWLQILDEYKY